MDCPLGLYLPDTGERLPVLDETGQPMGDDLPLFSPSPQRCGLAVELS